MYTIRPEEGGVRFVLELSLCTAEEVSARQEPFVKSFGLGMKSIVEIRKQDKDGVKMGRAPEDLIFLGDKTPCSLA